MERLKNSCVIMTEGVVSHFLSVSVVCLSIYLMHIIQFRNHLLDHSDKLGVHFLNVIGSVSKHSLVIFHSNSTLVRRASGGL